MSESRQTAAAFDGDAGVHIAPNGATYEIYYESGEWYWEKVSLSGQSLGEAFGPYTTSTHALAYLNASVADEMRED